MSTSASSAEILSILRHVTANKWDKAAARLATIDRHVRDAEAALSSGSGENDSRSVEDDVLMLLTTVRKAFAGSLHTQVSARGAVGGRRGGRGGSASHGRTTGLEDRLDTIERMLWEAKYSSAFSNSAALAWRNELLGYLHQGQRRMAYTILFGHLTNEWTEFRFGELSKSGIAPNNKDPETSEDEKAPPVIVGRKEMYEQREVWERHVTNERRTDKDRIIDFLDGLFHSGPRHEHCSGDEPTDLRAILLRNIRKRISTACKEKIPVTTSTVMNAIRGVLSSDQLTSEKRRALLDMSNKENVLSEIADILNIDTHLDSIRRWSWGDNPITVQMRKAINGKYRVYLDLDLLDAILIQCVGQFISVNIKTALAEAWKSDVRPVWQQLPDEARTAAMQTQIKDFTFRKTSHSVHALRKSIYERIFYAVWLPADTADVDDSYDDSCCASDDDDGLRLTDLENGPPSKYSLRTDILRVCSAEMAVQKLVHGQFCVVQSDFEWFGPSLPHSTLVAIMKYFHFPGELVHFVETFLAMRMRFEEDGEDGPVLTRRTGIPVSFQLTDGISELLLFTLDFAVNQRTGGAHLYRNHDDLWFWGQPAQCSVAWETICHFTDMMGLQLNKDKTASAHAVDESNPRYAPVERDMLERLPSGYLKWGFLLFDPREWKWIPNMPAIKEHMDELRFQLKSRTAVMAHVQAYNVYIENFLPNNFSQVVTGLGDSHAIMVLQALQYAQQCLYGGGDGRNAPESANVAQHVRKMIQQSFGSRRRYDVPDCFLYMDVDSGGLGLANPVPAFAQFVHLAKDEEYKDEDSMAPMQKAMYKVKKELSESYRLDGKTFAERFHAKQQKNRLGQRPRRVHPSASGDVNEDLDVGIDAGDEAQAAGNTMAMSQFMSFSDYVAASEEHSRAVRDLYRTMVDAPAVNGSRPRAGTKNWASAVFHTQLEELFGGWIAEDEFLSLGLYRTLAEEKVRWDMKASD